MDAGFSGSRSGAHACDLDLKMSTMEKQLDEKALKLKMLRDELQLLASDTLSQRPEMGAA